MDRKEALGVTMHGLELLAVLLILGCLTGLLAKSKNRDFAPWFVFGALFFLIAIIALLVAPAIPERKKIGPRKVPRFQCPECGELIATSAKLCHYCKAVITAKDKKPKFVSRLMRRR